VIAFGIDFSNIISISSSSGTATGGQEFDSKKHYESQFSYEGTNPSAMNPNVAPAPSFEATTESGRRSNFVQV